MKEAGRQFCIVWRISIGLLALQLLGMLVFTTIQYDRFNLTTDFAAYSQAWSAIAHGHLNPYSTAFGQPFWRNDFELLMWPMALLILAVPPRRRASVASSGLGCGRGNRCPPLGS